jgi:hypothetical protein
VRFIETPIFTEDVSNELSSDEYHRMQVGLMLRPEQGAVIRGSGGLRKIRWRRAGMGKRGGLRAIYYWDAESETFYMLTIYRKSKQEELAAGQLRVLQGLVAEEFK